MQRNTNQENRDFELRGLGKVVWRIIRQKVFKIVAGGAIQLNMGYIERLFAPDN